MNYDQMVRIIEHLGTHEQLGPAGQGWGIEQNPHELATFLTSIPVPETVLEIGTGYKGGLARFLAEALGCEVITVDINPLSDPIPSITQVVGRSEDVVGKVYNKYDLVIIDGDHSYDAVKLDYALYGNMGEIIMFHDVAGLRQCDGVAQFWQEISTHKTKRSKRRNKGYYEVIADGPQRAGIGWVVKSEQQ